MLKAILQSVWEIHTYQHKSFHCWYIQRYRNRCSHQVCLYRLVDTLHSQ